MICFSVNGELEVKKLAGLIGASGVGFARVLAFSIKTGVALTSCLSKILPTLLNDRNPFISIGIIATAATTSTRPIIAIMLYAAPSDKLPVSPMKNFDGYLFTRNSPSEAPAKTNEIIEVRAA